MPKLLSNSERELLQSGLRRVGCRCLARQRLTFQPTLSIPLLALVDVNTLDTGSKPGALDAYRSGECEDIKKEQMTPERKGGGCVYLGITCAPYD